MHQGTTSVALKTLNKNGNQAFDFRLDELFREAQIMLSLKHGNLLEILGITYLDEEKQFSLVMKWMVNGSLLDYLRKTRQDFLQSPREEVTSKLNSFARQIFEAMLFLEEKSIIHRDLAARNCLIGENQTLKLADFGLSRFVLNPIDDRSSIQFCFSSRLTECGLYKGNQRTIFALRWSSPEVVSSTKFSSRSDVWSYVRSNFSPMKLNELFDL